MSSDKNAASKKKILKSATVKSSTSKDKSSLSKSSLQKSRSQFKLFIAKKSTKVIAVVLVIIFLPFLIYVGFNFTRVAFNNNEVIPYLEEKYGKKFELRSATFGSPYFGEPLSYQAVVSPADNPELEFEVGGKLGGSKVGDGTVFYRDAYLQKEWERAESEDLQQIMNSAFVKSKSLPVFEEAAVLPTGDPLSYTLAIKVPLAVQSKYNEKKVITLKEAIPKYDSEDFNERITYTLSIAEYKSDLTEENDALKRIVELFSYVKSIAPRSGIIEYTLKNDQRRILCTINTPQYESIDAEKLKNCFKE